ncbi:MAG: hypothetical protein VX498_05885 [Myxococcota bacterium]|nr:hypothetical protein [Myxococcota bacterium]
MRSMTHRGLSLAGLALLLAACPIDRGDNSDGELATLEVVNATGVSLEVVELRPCGEGLGTEVLGPPPGVSTLVEDLEPGCWQGRGGYPGSECWADWNELGNLPAGEVSTWEVTHDQVVDCFGR